METTLESLVAADDMMQPHVVDSQASSSSEDFESEQSQSGPEQTHKARAQGLESPPEYEAGAGQPPGAPKKKQTMLARPAPARPALPDKQKQHGSNEAKAPPPAPSRRQRLAKTAPASGPAVGNETASGRQAKESLPAAVRRYPAAAKPVALPSQPVESGASDGATAHLLAELELTKQKLAAALLRPITPPVSRTAALLPIHPL